MPLDTLAQVPAAPRAPERADTPTIVPRRVFWLSANPVPRTAGRGYVRLFRSMPVLPQPLSGSGNGALYPRILGVRTVIPLGPVAVATESAR
ncbi:hypothetical protein J2Z21_005462 [Streptomyces griseochromogenes]|uniref:Uncharacterized protein n=1 Tax=Streptomyces griseochromogenes TaxID=68214 RepID=A0A1B1B5R9_9ACTN|nr:hypothetical protein [Streptomyces griseochromogenes]ANP54168.1 hypothetical protein AVL59_35465 [Streptomyces griseochromogenes]MBP2052479.1 hypothetical protein [Streptomyces griseochromogenes]